MTYQIKKEKRTEESQDLETQQPTPPAGGEELHDQLEYFIFTVII